MSIIHSIVSCMSPYVDARERTVGSFFNHLTEHSSGFRARVRLNELVQVNVAVINLWTEAAYKGYDYLTKSERRMLYAHVDLIAADFHAFYLHHQRPAEEVLQVIHGLNPSAHPTSTQVVLLQALLDYFSPDRGVYEYRESSSFGRLLRDPRSETLVGDCNQIVTLYIYLYSRYFSVNELAVRLLPGHVALHCSGIDIEVTRGTFAWYDERRGAALMPIEEIVSINLLDTTDEYLHTHEIAATDLLQASRFAFVLSHDRAIVARNLEIAYARLIGQLVARNKYSHALTLAKQSHVFNLLTTVGRNGALYYMQQHQFSRARAFAQHVPKATDLIRAIYRAEGMHDYDSHHYRQAIEAFKHYGDNELIRRCYEALFFDEQAKLPAQLTVHEAKLHGRTIANMELYARKSGNPKLIKHVHSINQYLL